MGALWHTSPVSAAETLAAASGHSSSGTRGAMCTSTSRQQSKLAAVHRRVICSDDCQQAYSLGEHVDVDQSHKHTFVCDLPEQQVDLRCELAQQLPKAALHQQRLALPREGRSWRVCKGCPLLQVWTYIYM